MTATDGELDRSARRLLRAARVLQVLAALMPVVLVVQFVISGHVAVISVAIAVGTLYSAIAVSRLNRHSQGD